MAHFTKTITADYNEILNMLDITIRNFGVSVKLVAENAVTVEKVEVTTRVYEKFFLRSSSYASISLTVIGNQEEVIISAIGAAGGEGLLNISWGAEKNFVTRLEKALIDQGF